MNNSNKKNNGYRISFTPKRLELEGQEYLNIFPYNVMFAGTIVESRKQKFVYSIYEPDLSSLTFNDKEKEISMIYYNICNIDNKDNYLRIAYHPDDDFYIGEKYNDNKIFSRANGKQWENFFFHFTRCGVGKGEGYVIDSEISKRLN